MAVAFSTKSRQGAADTTLATGNMSWSHAAAATARAVVVAVIEDLNTDQVTAVTYGGQALTRVISTPRNTTETSRVYLYFLGTGIPTGTQTVAVTVSGSAPKVGHCFTFTAAADTEVDASGGTDLGIIANPSRTITHTGTLTGWVGVAAQYYGASAPVSTGLQTGETYGYGVDFGSAAGMTYYRTGGADASSSTYGYTTLASDDQLIAALVIKESGAAPQDVDGTVAVVSTTTGDVTVLGPASGTVAVVSTTAGAPTSTQGVSGTTAVVSATTGSATSRQSVSGTVAVTTASTGAVVTVAPVSGAVPVVSATTGSAIPLRPVSATVTVTTATSGTVSSRQVVSGSTPIVSTASGAPDNAADLNVSGTVTVTSAATGAPTSRQTVSGTVTVTTASTGSVRLLAVAVGVVPVTVASTGTVSSRRLVGGTIPIVSAASGSPDIGGSLSVSGAVTITSTAAGVAVSRRVVGGTVAVVTTTVGDVAATLTAAGAVSVITTTAGGPGLVTSVAGTVTILSSTSGVVSDPAGLFIPRDLTATLRDANLSASMSGRHPLTATLVGNDRYAARDHGSRYSANDQVGPLEAVIR